MSQHCTGGEHSIAFNHRAVHDGGGQANKRAIMQDAAVQHDIMANEHIVANDGWKPVLNPGHRAVTMDDAAVLNIRARANNHAVNLCADDAIIPDACFCGDGHISNDPATRRNKGGFVDYRRLAVQGNDADVVAHVCHWVSIDEYAGVSGLSSKQTRRHRCMIGQYSRTSRPLERHERFQH